MRQLRSLAALGISAALFSGCAGTVPVSSNAVSAAPPVRRQAVVFAYEPWPAWVIYDGMLADSIQNRWFQLLEEQTLPDDVGRVVLDFQLHSDGTIDDMFVVENTEGLRFETLCAKAILDPVPFRPWPEEVLRQFGDSRRFRVSFEFDAQGLPYLSYTEQRDAFFDAGKTPERTYLVLNCRKRPARLLNRVAYSANCRAPNLSGV